MDKSLLNTQDTGSKDSEGHSKGSGDELALESRHTAKPCRDQAGL